MATQKMYELLSSGRNVSSLEINTFESQNETIDDIMGNITFRAHVATSQSLFITRLIVQKYLVPFVVACGIVGNFFNIVVLVNPKMRTSTNIYLMSLAFCDSLYLLFTLTLSFLHCSNKTLSVDAFRYIPIARVLSDLFGNTAVWLTVCFTLERYVAVRFPIRGKAWCTVKKAKVAIFATALACFVNTFPEFFETRIKRIYVNRTTHSWHYACVSSDFANRPSYQFGYYWWFVAIFTFTPLVLLSVFNFLLIRSVWAANRKRQMLSQTRVTGEAIKNTHEQQRVTMMLISVVVIFLVCQTPQAILLIYRSYVQARLMKYPADFIKIAGNICNLLVQINSSVNFILYSYFSCKFRRTFRQVFCRCRRHNNNMNSSVTYYHRTSAFRTGSMSLRSSQNSASKMKATKRDIIVEIT
ncbi:FMRFamide receptor-like [Ruditapes philippinarum]|uniref:FMRFamide receptor-like n=1 Tax=Ruditapes philippinarum TaxID=129788 RepID=UPI00295AFAA8|nr:FMRFamide receptor-like [Ruditapes philippinarum]